MLNDRYLVMGVDALARAHTMNFFADGHRGGAMVSAYFLCREGGVEEGVDAILAEMIDREYGPTPLCEPFPGEKPDPALAGQVAQALRENSTGLRMAGHNIILPALALKAFHHLPALVTPSRVAGVCALARSFTEVDPVTGGDDDILHFEDTPAWAEFVLGELLAAFEAFDGRGQGWSGHLMTLSRALLDLRASGYGDTADAAEDGWRCYIRRIRMGPGERDKPRPEHAESPLRPHTLAYWQARRDRELGLGHLIKYPYGYHGITRLAADEELLKRCDAAAYRIF